MSAEIIYTDKYREQVGLNTLKNRSYFLLDDDSLYFLNREDSCGMMDVVHLTPGNDAGLRLMHRDTLVKEVDVKIEIYLKEANETIELRARLNSHEGKVVVVDGVEYELKAKQ